MFRMTDEQWNAMSKAEQDAIIRREADAVIHQCEMVNAGLAVRQGGLVYFLPLCHDSYGAGL